MYKVVSSFILSALLAVSSLSSVMAAKPSVITPQEYGEYLTERGKEDPEALKVRQQFLNLSSQDQQKFIDYMNDPKIMEEMFNTPVPENSKKELHGGDIVIEHKTETEIISETEPEEEKKPSITALFCGSCFAAPPIKTFKITHVRTLKWLGLQAKFTVWVLYTAQGNTVKAIKGGNGHYSNSIPVTIKKESVSKYIHGNKAQTCIVWRVSPIVWSKLNLDFWCFCGHHDVIGGPTGAQSYRFYKS